MRWRSMHIRRDVRLHGRYLQPTDAPPASDRPAVHDLRARTVLHLHDLLQSYVQPPFATLRGCRTPHGYSLQRLAVRVLRTALIGQRDEPCTNRNHRTSGSAPPGVPVLLSFRRVEPLRNNERTVLMCVWFLKIVVFRKFVWRENICACVYLGAWNSIAEVCLYYFVFFNICWLNSCWNSNCVENKLISFTVFIWT